MGLKRIRYCDVCGREIGNGNVYSPKDQHEIPSAFRDGWYTHDGGVEVGGERVNFFMFGTVEDEDLFALDEGGEYATTHLLTFDACPRHAKMLRGIKESLLYQIKNIIPIARQMDEIKIENKQEGAVKCQ